MLMAVSTGIAFAGIGIAAFFWLRTPARRATALAARFRRPARLLSNKYYVDEIYDAVIVQPIKLRLDAVLVARRGRGRHRRRRQRRGRGGAQRSSRLRRLQTGSVRTYAAALFVGVGADRGLVPVDVSVRAPDRD